jgi:hypothetical protein
VDNPHNCAATRPQHHFLAAQAAVNASLPPPLLLHRRKAVQFLVRLKELVEDPESLLIEG